MSSSANLKIFRQQTGLSAEELAAKMGITNAAYYDLENSDDLENCISLGDIKSLAALLRIRPVALFADNPELSPQKRISPHALAKRISGELKHRQISLSQYEEQVGWSLREFLLSPEAGFLEWNIDNLRDVCVSLGIDWLDIINWLDQSEPSEQGAKPNGSNPNS